MNDQILEPDTGVSLPQNSVPFEQLHFPSDCDGEEDYHWALNDPEVRRLYSGLVVVVHQHTVWGVGKTYEAAWEDAQRKPNCPSESETAFVVI